MTQARALAVLALSLAACGGSSSSKTSPPPGLQSGWNPVPGMQCADGSPTGIGLSPGRSDKVLFYLSPGGACWGSADCGSDILRSFGASEYTLVQLLAAPGTIFDRTLAGNPFADWTFVFVPYCTGDVHAGQSVATHGTQSWQHHGWANLHAAVAAATGGLPRPSELVVAGSSAGGFGALAAYDLVRAEWDPAGGTGAMLLDDSGPTFVGAAMPPQLLARWWDVWGLGSTIGSICAGCATDLSTVWPALHGRHPADRLALVSTLQDATMIGFFADPDLQIPEMAATTFQSNVDGLAAFLAGLGPKVGMYQIGGAAQQRHALLDDSFFLGPANPQGPALLDWVSAMVALDPTWASSTSL
jgi:hypothetical protein